jgi:hypothetical protein
LEVKKHTEGRTHPYSRSEVIEWFESMINYVDSKRANYVRMETSLNPPFWLLCYRERRRGQEAKEAAARSKSDYFSRDPDTVLSPLLESTTQSVDDKESSRIGAAV